MHISVHFVQLLSKDSVNYVCLSFTITLNMYICHDFTFQKATFLTGMCRIFIPTVFKPRQKKKKKLNT